MFGHYFRYTFLDFIRNKVIIFWVVLFPMILGSLFNFAFMNIYENTEVFHEIPVAIVENEKGIGAMKLLINGMEQMDMKLIDAVSVSEEEALSLLEKGEVDGVIYDDLTAPKLTVRSEDSLSASILKAFLDRYKSTATVIVDIFRTSPSKLPEVLVPMFTESGDCLVQKTYTDGNMNPYVTYMYNLLAMACLFVSMIGQFIAINSQANLSAKGARISVAPMNRLAYYTASILAALVIFYTGIMIASAYLVFILGIDFGIGFGEIALVNFFGVLLGLSLGFFIGSIGRMSENTKLAILLLFSLGTGFLSGLMAGDMPAMIEESCPIINRLNPSRLIADSYYTISTYGFNDRLLRNILTLLAWTLLFIIIGTLLTRKRKYKSL